MLGMLQGVFLAEAAWKETLAVPLPLSPSQVGCFCPENKQ